MEEDVFEIVEEGTEGAEQVTVVKVFCKKCSDYELHTPEVAKRIESDFEHYECKNCFVKDGRLKSVTVQDVCGVCQKPFSRTGPRTCYCPKKEEFGLKITTKDWKGVGKDPTLSRMNDQISESKTQRLLVSKVNKAKLKPYETQQKTNELLENIVKLLQPKTEQVTPPKEYKGSAIN